jgi:hypothetical protein
MALIIFFLSLNLSAAPACTNKNDSRSMCSGKSFLAEEAGHQCRKDLKVCEREASVHCASKAVAKVDCVQQYGGVWMTKCVCK